jgi:hypothetical protein
MNSLQQTMVGAEVCRVVRILMGRSGATIEGVNPHSCLTTVQPGSLNRPALALDVSRGVPISGQIGHQIKDVSH